MVEQQRTSSPARPSACLQAVVSAGTGQAYCRSPDTIFMRKCKGRPIAPESRSALARTSGA
mgnify:CR=1 FL=1